MPKRFSKNTARQPARPPGATAQTADASAASAGGTVDTESEFSVPRKWQENEQENAAASQGPASAARDGERTEEAADSRPS